MYKRLKTLMVKDKPDKVLKVSQLDLSIKGQTIMYQVAIKAFNVGAEFVTWNYNGQKTAVIKG